VEDGRRQPCGGRLEHGRVINNLKLMGAGAGAGLCRLALPDRNALDYKGLFIKAE